MFYNKIVRRVNMLDLYYYFERQPASTLLACVIYYTEDEFQEVIDFMKQELDSSAFDLFINQLYPIFYNMKINNLFMCDIKANNFLYDMNEKLVFCDIGDAYVLQKSLIYNEHDNQ